MRIGFSILFICISLISIAQKYDSDDDEIRTILGDLKSRSNGGYGEFSIKYAKIAQNDAFLHGGGGSWIFKSYFFAGFSAYVFNTSEFSDFALGVDCRYSGGYGGLNFGFIIAPRSAIHLTIPVVTGGGVVTYMKHFRGLYDIKDWRAEDTEVFALVEPGIEIEFNLLKFCRFSIGAHYLFNSNYELNYAADGRTVESFHPDILENISYGIHLKFGKF